MPKEPIKPQTKYAVRMILPSTSATYMQMYLTSTQELRNKLLKFDLGSD